MCAWKCWGDTHPFPLCSFIATHISHTHTHTHTRGCCGRKHLHAERGSNIGGRGKNMESNRHTHDDISLSPPSRRMFLYKYKLPRRKEKKETWAHKQMDRLSGEGGGRNNNNTDTPTDRYALSTINFEGFSSWASFAKGHYHRSCFLGSCCLCLQLPQAFLLCLPFCQLTRL